MRRIVLWFVLGPLLLVGQSIPLNGVITVHNSAYRTGKTVHVRDAAVRAAQAKPVSSDVEGRFALEVVGMEAGAAVRLSVQHDKWVALDPHALERVVLGTAAPLVIRMTDPKELTAERIKYHGVAEAAIVARYKYGIARLRDSTVALRTRLLEVTEQFGDTTVELADAFNVLEDQRQKALDDVERLTEHFVLADLDAASERFRRAFEAFASGRLTEALGLLDQQELEEQRAKAIEQHNSGEQAISEANNAIREIHRCYGLRADVLDASLRPYEAYKARSSELLVVEENEDAFGPEVLVRALWGVAHLENDLGLLAASERHTRKAFTIPWINGPDAQDDRLKTLRVHGVCMGRIGQKDSVRAVQREILRIGQGMDPRPFRSMSLAYSSLADLQENAGEYKAALVLLDSARVYALQDSSSAELLIPDILAQMGSAHGELYQFPEAIELITRSIELEQARATPNRLYIALRLFALSRVQYMNGQAEPALANVRRSKDAYVHVFGADHPAVYMMDGSLAFSMKMAGRSDSALTSMDRCIDGLSNWFGKDWPELAMRYNNRASILGDMGRNREAIADYRHSSALIVGNSKKERLGRAMNLASIGSYFYNIAELDSSLINLRQGLDTLAAVHGTVEHPDAIPFHGLLGRTLIDRDRVDSAIIHLRIAHSLNEKVFGPDNPNLLKVLAQLARAYRYNGQLDSARVAVDNSLRIIRTGAGPITERVDALKECSFHFEWAGDAGRALILADSCLTVALSPTSPKPATVRSARSTNGSMLMLNARYDEALQQFRLAMPPLPSGGYQGVVPELSLLGGALLLSGRTDTARIVIQEAVRLNGDADALWYEYLLKKEERTADQNVDALIRWWNERRMDYNSSPLKKRTIWEELQKMATIANRMDDLDDLEPIPVQR